MLIVKWPKVRVAGSHPDAWQWSSSIPSKFFPWQIQPGVCWSSGRAGFPLYLAGSSEEDVTGQLGQPRQEVFVVKSPGTEAEGWLFQPSNGSAAPVHGHQAWAFPHIRGMRVRDGGSRAAPCAQTFAPTAWLCRYTGMQRLPLLFLWTHKSPAALPLGGEENSGKHGIVRKSNYLITKQWNHSANPSACSKAW